MSALVSVSAKKHLAIGLKLDPSSTINGFNFSFTSMLLGKLKKLIEEGRLSQHENSRSQPDRVDSDCRNGLGTFV